MATIKSTDQKIAPCLWFNENAAAAVKFYTSVFKKSKKGTVTYYGKNGPMPEGTVLTATFRIEGQEFIALNAGPRFKFTEAISFVIYCKTQKEIDYYWEELSRGGEKSMCGWLKDKFGVSWQVVPIVIYELMTDKDAEKSSSVLDAISDMKKLDIKALKLAHRNAGEK